MLKVWPTGVKTLIRVNKGSVQASLQMVQGVRIVPRGHVG